MSSYEGPFTTLGDVLEATRGARRVLHPRTAARAWEYLKGAEARGADPVDRPRLLLLRGRRSLSPSLSTNHPNDPHRRGRHDPPASSTSSKTEDGRLRRLTPMELERLNGFPDDWTDRHARWTPRLHDGQRARGGLVERVGGALAEDDVARWRSRPLEGRADGLAVRQEFAVRTACSARSSSWSCEGAARSSFAVRRVLPMWTYVERDRLRLLRQGVGVPGRGLIPRNLVHSPSMAPSCSAEGSQNNGRPITQAPCGVLRRGPCTGTISMCSHAAE